MLKAGLGGTTVFFNGAVGGLMCTHPSIGVKDVFTDTIYNEPSYDKTKAVGYKVALLSLDALANPDTIIENPTISLKAKTLNLTLDNPNFVLGAVIGLLDKGMTEWKKTRSEIAVFTIGPASFISVPGEIYPEIVNGGVIAVEGQDFKIDPIETPHLRKLMPGKYKFVIGLSNDEIGYIIPKSEWDVEPPFMYDPTGPYGEENSFGPETAPVLYKEFVELLNDL